MIMFPGFLSGGTKEVASQPKSRPVTMIMFTGFLSDGTKELAGNYDHVYKVLSNRTKELAGNYDHVSRVPE